MSTTSDTTKVSGRRQLHFDHLQDIGAEVEKLAVCKDIRTLGNWSAGQVLQHLANAMNNSIDGTLPMLPGVMRFFLRLFMKRRFLNKTMSAGFKLPAKAAALIPGPTTLDEGLRSFRQALQRLQTETKRAPNPAIGPLTREEWDRLHCRHSELHLSFLVPVS